MITKGMNTQQRRLRRILIVELCLFTIILVYYSITVFPDFYQKKLFYSYFHPPNIAFYKDKKNQTRGFYLQTLGAPIIKNQALLSWAELAVITVNTLSSSTYQAQLQNAFDIFFTPDGASSLLNAFDRKGVIREIVAKKLSVTSVVQKTPILLDQGEFLGRRIWKIQVPILVTYESLSDISVDKQLVTLTFASVPTTDNPQGIAIDQYQSEKR